MAKRAELIYPAYGDEEALMIDNEIVVSGSRLSARRVLEALGYEVETKTIGTGLPEFAANELWKRFMVHTPHKVPSDSDMVL